jgi:hypothetical protein
VSAGPSAVSILAELRLEAESARAQAQAVREAIIEELSGINIDIGTTITESFVRAAPNIRQTVAETVSAAVEEGIAAGVASSGGALASMGGRAAFHESDLGFPGVYSGNYWQGMGQRQLPGRDIAGESGPANVWASQEYPFEGSATSSPPLLIDGPQAGDPTTEAAVAAEEASGGAAGAVAAASMGGMGMLGRMALTYGVFRMGRAEEENYERKTESLERYEEAEEMPGGTARQREQREQKKFEDKKSDYDNSISFIDWFNDVITNKTGLALAAPTFGIAPLIAGTEEYYQGLGTARSDKDQAGTDLNYAKRDENAENEKRLQLENEITDATLKGNRAREDHLKLLEQLGQTEEKMNANAPGSGTAWFNSTGLQLLQGQSTEAAAQSDIEHDVAAEARQDPQIEAKIMHMEATGDKGGAAKFAFQEGLVRRQQEALNKQTMAEAAEKAASPTYSAVARAGGVGGDFSPGAMAVIQSEADAEAAKGEVGPATKLLQAHQMEQVVYAATASENKDYDALHHEMTFTTGLETWKRMQQAGYGSVAGDDSGARRVYAGGAVGGGDSPLVHPGSPLIHSGSPLIHHSGPGDPHYGHPITPGSGAVATHPMDGSSFGGSAWSHHAGSESGIGRLLDQQQKDKERNEEREHERFQTMPGPEILPPLAHPTPTIDQRVLGHPQTKGFGSGQEDPDADKRNFDAIHLRALQNQAARLHDPDPNLGPSSSAAGSSGDLPSLLSKVIKDNSIKIAVMKSSG